MRTIVKTLKTRAVNPSQKSVNLALWLRTCDNKLRGMHVSGSVFESGNVILGIRCGGEKGIRVDSGVLKGSEANVRFETMYGPVKAKIKNKRLFVNFPSEIAVEDEYPAHR